MNKEQLSALVAEILGQMEPAVKASHYRPTEAEAQPKQQNHRPGDFVPELTDPHPLLGHDDAVVWTGDSFVDGDIIRSVKEQYGLKSGLFDMEATAICQAAEMFDLPVVVIKMVSDVPEEGDDEFSYDAFVDAHTDFSAFVDYLEELR